MEDRRLLAVITVTNALDVANGTTASIADLIANDGGDGVSLREAIVAANSTANAGGVDEIRFAIPGDGAQTIQLNAALPQITDPVMIDGLTQLGAVANSAAVDAAINADLRIALDGSTIVGGADGLDLRAGGSTVRGLAIHGFQGNGIVITLAGGNVIEGNFIGVRPDGVTPAPNANSGVRITDSPNNQLGGSTAAARNLISANTGDGVSIVGNASSDNRIFGNFVGTDRTGSVDLGNRGSGVTLSNAPNNVLGGEMAGQRNVVSGNEERGVRIVGGGATGNRVRGNYIGVTASGTADLGNSFAGVTLSGVSNNDVGGLAPGEGNVISGNDSRGVEIGGVTAMNNRVLGNVIGLDATGMTGIPNTGSGVLVEEATNNQIGSIASGGGNRIGRNGANGVEVTGVNALGNSIRGNSIFENVGIGIELASGTGPTPNDLADLDTGPNRLQNFPEIDGNIVIDSNQASITYEISALTATSTFPLTIDFYLADVDGEEGLTLFASDTFAVGDQGNPKTVMLPTIAGLANARVVAMVTDADGNSSEFSGASDVVKAPDRFEGNNTLAAATALGSEPTVIERNLTIHAAGDVDFFRMTAHDTGRLVVRIFFPHADGDLNLEIQDAAGNVVAASAISGPLVNLEELIVPVVGQQAYFVRVFSADGMVNCYDLEIENFAAQAPTAVLLDLASDLGRRNDDLLTSDATPTLVIQADVLGLVDANQNNQVDLGEIVPLTAAQASAGNVPGAAVEVTLVNLNNPAQPPRVFFADPFSLTAPNLYQVTPGTPLVDGQYVATARIVVIDGQTPNRLGRSAASPPLRFVVDTVKPNVFFGSAALGGDGLAAGSDSGIATEPGALADRVTRVDAPTLFGFAEANATVRVYVRNAAGQRVLLGETVATPFVGNNPLETGRWTLTSSLSLNSPQLGFATIDGLRKLEVEAVDVAGNVSQGVGFSFAPLPQAIADATTTLYEINIPDYVGPISDVDVALDITHPVDGELTATLTSAAGTPVTLFDAIGADGDDFRGTFFDDEAADGIETGTAPFTGRFRPQIALSAVDGQGASGPWRLRITDNAVGNVGVLNSFSLWFQSDLHIVVDTQGPRVDNVVIASAPGHNLLLPKPSVDGPTPQVDRLTIYFSDLPARVDQMAPGDDFIYDAIAASVAAATGNYRVVGDRSGVAPIDSVTIDQGVKVSAAVTTPISDAEFVAASLIGVPASQRPAVGDFLRINHGPLEGQLRRIMVFDAATGQVTVEAPFGGVPALGDGFSVLRAASLAHAGVVRPNATTDARVTTAGSTSSFTAERLVGVAAPLRPAVGDYLRFDSGANAGQIRRVASFNAATGAIDVNGSFASAPAAGDVFALVTGARLNTASATLQFSEPLLDDRFTLTVSDQIVDPAGNALDGESTASAAFPSGNGQPGGAFTTRFNVDSRAEIGVWSAGVALVDTNGNASFDPDGFDVANRDIAYKIGFSADNAFAGNFAADGGAVADGFDKLAVYGTVGNQWRWALDTNNDGVADLFRNEGAVNGLPVAGNFDGNVANGDEVGIFTGSRWHFDANHDFVTDGSVSAAYQGFPIVGDFDGDGDDDVATYIASVPGGNKFSIDLNTAGVGAPVAIDGVADFVFQVGVGGAGDAAGFNAVPGVRERPIAADMNGDGIDDLGLWVPDSGAVSPGDLAEWFFLASGDDPTTAGVEVSVMDRIANGFVAFRPTPFGEDLYARFGNDFSVPLVGNFDPPPLGSRAAVVTRAAGATTPASGTLGDAAVGVASRAVASPVVASPVVVAPIAKVSLAQSAATAAQDISLAEASLFGTLLVGASVNGASVNGATISADGLLAARPPALDEDLFGSARTSTGAATASAVVARPNSAPVEDASGGADAKRPTAIISTNTASLERAQTTGHDSLEEDLFGSLIVTAPSLVATPAELPNLGHERTPDFVQVAAVHSKEVVDLIDEGDLFGVISPNAVVSSSTAVPVDLQPQDKLTSPDAKLAVDDRASDGPDDSARLAAELFGPAFRVETHAGLLAPSVATSIEAPSSGPASTSITNFHLSSTDATKEPAPQLSETVASKVAGQSEAVQERAAQAPRRRFLTLRSLARRQATVSTSGDGSAGSPNAAISSQEPRVSLAVAQAVVTPDLAGSEVPSVAAQAPAPQAPAAPRSVAADSVPAVAASKTPLAAVDAYFSSVGQAAQKGRRIVSMRR